eukprot:scaffold2814_cov154-Isochrysis_galbana.AAC.1
MCNVYMNNTTITQQCAPPHASRCSALRDPPRPKAIEPRLYVVTLVIYYLLFVYVRHTQQTTHKTHTRLQLKHQTAELG